MRKISFRAQASTAGRPGRVQIGQFQVGPRGLAFGCGGYWDISARDGGKPAGLWRGTCVGRLMSAGIARYKGLYWALISVGKKRHSALATAMFHEVLKLDHVAYRCLSYMYSGLLLGGDRRVAQPCL